MHRFASAALILLALCTSPALAEQQQVRVGNFAGDGTGDPARTAFTKLNHNDAELYASVATLTNAVSGKAPLTHTHSLADIIGLTSALAGKSPTASPVFTGVVTAPSVTITGSGSTFASRPTFNGATPWDSGNLDPTTYLPLTGGTLSGPLTISGVNSQINAFGSSLTGFVMRRTANATDAKTWDVVDYDGVLRFRAINDAGTVPTDWLRVVRSGATPTAINFSTRPGWLGVTPYDTGNFNPALLAPLASPAFTGTATFVNRPTWASGAIPYDNANLNMALYAPLAFPAFTGTPTAPTAAAGTSTTQLATTAFVATGLTTKATNTDWTTYSPAITCVSGSFATAPTVTASYSRVANNLSMSVRVVTAASGNGTCAGGLLVPLPVTAMQGAILIGRENGVTGKAVIGYAATTTASLFLYDSSYSGGNNTDILVSGSYRVAP